MLPRHQVPRYVLGRCSPPGPPSELIRQRNIGLAYAALVVLVVKVQTFRALDSVSGWDTGDMRVKSRYAVGRRVVLPQERAGADDDLVVYWRRHRHVGQSRQGVVRPQPGSPTEACQRRASNGYRVRPSVPRC